MSAIWATEPAWTNRFCYPEPLLRGHLALALNAHPWIAICLPRDYPLLTLGANCRTTLPYPLQLPIPVQ